MNKNRTIHKPIKFFLLNLAYFSLVGCGGELSSKEENNSTSTTKDITPPVITILGEKNISFAEGGMYTELGATATDDIDSNVTVSLSGSVDTTKIGTYTITYTATDKANNTATATRIVIVNKKPVVDSTPPVITLKGTNPLNLTVGDAYTEAGVTVNDTVDGSITVSPSGSVDTSKAGTYTITYTAIDKANNTATATRTIIVIKKVVDIKLPWEHGNLKVSVNKKILQYPDGTGFFWMADTAWDLYSKTRADIDLYMDNRAAKKFTVIQAVALHYHGSESNGESPFLDNDIRQPNESYWKHIDYMLSKAEAKDMYVALLPTWHYAVKAKTFKSPADATYFGKWIGNRYKNRPNIIWVIGGDTPLDGSRVNLSKEEEIAMWNALGFGIDSVDSNHLITFHPLATIPSVVFGNPSWLDFNMLQSGRGATSTSVESVQSALHESSLPVVDGESLYEGLAYADKGNSDRRTAFQMRDDAYSQIFAGAFGNTYGHDAIFRFWESTDTARCDGWICTPNMTWREAINAPGAAQMAHVTTLMQSRPIVGRIPDQSLILGSPSAKYDFAATRGNGYVFIYSAEGKNFTVVMGKISGSEVKAWWYNPRNGQSRLIGEFANSGTQAFNPPGDPISPRKVTHGLLRDGNDWVLVLDDINKGFGTPGQ